MEEEKVDEIISNNIKSSFLKILSKIGQFKILKESSIIVKKEVVGRGRLFLEAEITFSYSQSTCSSDRCREITCSVNWGTHTLCSRAAFRVRGEDFQRETTTGIYPNSPLTADFSHNWPHALVMTMCTCLGDFRKTLMSEYEIVSKAHSRLEVGQDLILEGLVK